RDAELAVLRQGVELRVHDLDAVVERLGDDEVAVLAYRDPRRAGVRAASRLHVGPAFPDQRVAGIELDQAVAGQGGHHEVAAVRAGRRPAGLDAGRGDERELAGPLGLTRPER